MSCSFEDVRETLPPAVAARLIGMMMGTGNVKEEDVLVEDVETTDVGVFVKYYVGPLTCFASAGRVENCRWSLVDVVHGDTATVAIETVVLR